MISIEELHGKSDRELIKMARDPDEWLTHKDMHGVALVLARRLENHLKTEESDLEYFQRLQAEHTHPVDMEAP